MDFGIAKALVRPQADHDGHHHGLALLHVAGADSGRGHSGCARRPVFGRRVAVRTGDGQAAVRWRQPVRHHVGAPGESAGAADQRGSATAAGVERRDPDVGGQDRQTRGSRRRALSAMLWEVWWPHRRRHRLRLRLQRCRQRLRRRRRLRRLPFRTPNPHQQRANVGSGWLWVLLLRSRQWSRWCNLRRGKAAKLQVHPPRQ